MHTFPYLHHNFMVVLFSTASPAKPQPVSSETAKIWSLSTDDVLDNDIVSVFFFECDIVNFLVP